MFPSLQDLSQRVCCTWKAMAPVMSMSSTAKNADEMDKVVHDFMESISNLELRNSWNGQIWLSFRNHQVYISLLLEKAYHADFRKTSLCLLFRPSKCFGKKNKPYPAIPNVSWIELGILNLLGNQPVPLFPKWACWGIPYFQTEPYLPSLGGEKITASRCRISHQKIPIKYPKSPMFSYWCLNHIRPDSTILNHI